MKGQLRASHLTRVVFIPGSCVPGRRPSERSRPAAPSDTTADQMVVIGTHKVMVHSRCPLTDAEKGT